MDGPDRNRAAGFREWFALSLGVVECGLALFSYGLRSEMSQRTASLEQVAGYSLLQSTLLICAFFTAAVYGGVLASWILADEKRTGRLIVAFSASLFVAAIAMFLAVFEVVPLPVRF